MLYRFICIDGPGSLVQARLLAKRLQSHDQQCIVISGQQLNGPAGYFIKRYKSGYYGPPASLNAYHVARIFGLTFIDINSSLSRILSDGILVICYDYVGSAVLSAVRSIAGEPQRNGFYLWCDQYFYQSLGLPRPLINVILDNRAEPFGYELSRLQPSDYMVINISGQFGIAKTHNKLVSIIADLPNLKIDQKIASADPDKVQNIVDTPKAPPISQTNNRHIYLQAVSTNQSRLKSLSGLVYKRGAPINTFNEQVRLLARDPVNELDIGLAMLKNKNASYVEKQQAAAKQLTKLKTTASKSNEVKYRWQINSSVLILESFIRMGFKKFIHNIYIGEHLNEYAKNQLSKNNIGLDLDRIEDTLRKSPSDNQDSPILLGQNASFELSLSYTQTARLLERLKLIKLSELDSIVAEIKSSLSLVHPLAYEQLVK